jgi:hypothetical protein
MINKVISWFKAEEIQGDLGANLIISFFRIFWAIAAVIGVVIGVFKLI